MMNKKKNQTFKTIPLDARYWGIDFAVNTKCGYSLEEIKKVLAEHGYDDTKYKVRIGYIRYMFHSVCEDYECDIWNMEGDYEEVKTGGRGAMKCYIFEETKEASDERWKKINDDIKSDYEKYSKEK